MKCGHCKSDHGSVAEVRACSRTGGVATMERPAPRKTPEAAITPKQLEALVPAARFALKRDGVWKFYKVDKPKEGRWAGYTFLSYLASDDRYPVKGTVERQRILSLIAADPKQAAVDYCEQVGRCCLCHRTLTAASSIEQGMGDKCAGKMGAW